MKKSELILKVNVCVNFREHANDFSDELPESNCRKVVKCFQKKVIDRERLAKMILEREVSLQLGAFDDMKSATWSPSSCSGIKINSSSNFNISAKSAKSSITPQR